MIERWKDISGYIGVYQVSNLGRVRSLNRTITCGRNLKGRILKDNLGTAYAIVSLSLNGVYRNEYVHMLVLAAFRGTCPEGMEVNHKDGNKKNARLKNLEYVSHSYNMKHAVKTGLAPSGENRSDSKLTTADIKEIRRLRGKVTGLSLARRFGVGASLISHIQLNKRRLHD